MFSRLKQNLREKTGRAVATQLPEKLEADMNYYLEWEKRDKQLVKSIQEVVESFKNGKKRNDMMDSLDEVGKSFNGNGPIGEGSSALRAFHEERVKNEKEGYEKVASLLKARCETFASSELRAVVDACNGLKKKRLARDAAESDYRSKPNDDRKAKFDCAEVEFKKALKQVEEYAAKIPEWDFQHKKNYVETIMALGVAFEVK